MFDQEQSILNLRNSINEMHAILQQASETRKHEVENYKMDIVAFADKLDAVKKELDRDIARVWAEINKHGFSQQIKEYTSDKLERDLYFCPRIREIKDDIQTLKEEVVKLKNKQHNMFNVDDDYCKKLIMACGIIFFFGLGLVLFK